MAPDIAASATKTPDVTAAIKRAGDRTGAGFDFLMKMAMRESSLDPKAKAGTSSAAGLFQFIDQTWLATVRKYGAAHGLGDYAKDIVLDGKGRLTVADAARRKEILDLRFDADASSAMAGALAGENKSYLERRIGRAATAADLYAAHFLGPAGAVKLLSAASSVKAADLLPQAARANAHVFYDGGRAKTVGEVIASIATSMGLAAPSPAPVATPAVMANAIDASLEGKPEAASERRRGRAPEVKSFTPSFPAPSRFAAMTLAVMQALDPTRLGASRNDDKSWKK